MKLQRHAHTKDSILKHLYYRGKLTSGELSVLTGKSLPSVTGLLTELVQSGYVIESGLGPSTGGRRPVKYLLNKKKKKYIVAVAMDQFYTRIVIYNLLNEPINQEVRLALPLHNNERAMDVLINTINAAINNAGLSKDNVVGIGIGMPGFVNVEKGTNDSYFFGQGTGLSLRDYLTTRLAVPTFIENDSSAIAIGEHHFGKAKGIKDAMVVNFGWGIGLGMIVNGNLFRGHNGYAGEFSHIPFSDSNKLCPCGKRGCLEVEASLLVAVDNAKEAMTRGETSNLSLLFSQNGKPEGDILVESALMGDQLAVSALSDAAFIIGRGISTLIHIMNPERIVISGRGGLAGKLLMAPVQRAINEYCIPKLAEQTDIVVSNMGYNAELLGAACLVVENTHLN